MFYRCRSTEPLYSVSQVQAAEHAAMASGIDAATLMQRAGAAAAAWVEQHAPKVSHVLVVCGRGNNGGDGLDLCRTSARQGFSGACDHDRGGSKPTQRSLNAFL